MRASLLTAMVALLAAVPAAQGPRSTAETDASRGTPRPAARIDAIVTDRQGRPVLDLKAADFELKAGGIVQQLDSVELKATHGSAARTFGFFLDEFHVSAENAVRARDVLLRFIDAQLRDDDRVVVMRPLDSQIAIEFAADRAAVRAAIERFEGRRGDYAPRTTFEERFLGRAPEAVQSARIQISTTALRALVTRLGEADGGRSAVAFVTEGFMSNRRTERDRRLPDLQGIVRAASRFNVAIYSLDPRDPSAASDEDQAERAAQLESLATQTGGEAAAGPAVPLALGRLARDLDAYYFLTFQPSRPADGRFQKIEVSARRGNLLVRARPVYWLPFPDVPRTRTSASAAAARTRSLRRSQQVDAWYGVARSASGDAELRVTWQPRKSPGPGRRVEPAAVVVKAAAAGGRTLFEGRITAVGSRAAGDLSDGAVFAVPAGRVEVDLTIVGRDGSVVDTETRDIDVPDFSAARAVMLAPHIIHARTQREFTALVANPGAPPTPLREFRRADRLLIRAGAYASGQSLPISARLLSRWQQPMRTLMPTTAPTAMTQFELPLSWLAPGEYDIEITAAGPAGELHERVSFRVTG